MPFPTQDLTAIPFQRSSGTTRVDFRYAEPGQWWNNKEGDIKSAHYPAITHVIDVELTGTDPNTGTWTVTVTPLTTQSGAAAADSMAPASISISSTNDALTVNVTDLIAAAVNASELEAGADLASWNRFRSYVIAGAGATSAELRLTAVQAGMTFSVSVTGPAGNSSSQTVISSPSTTTLKVGCYAEIDTDQGTSGYDEHGRPYLKVISSTSTIANIVGPIYLGSDTEPLEAGALFREYAQRSTPPIVTHGYPLACNDSLIAASSVGTPVYVRHTASGNYVPGMVTDATGAAVGATANVWTGTPTSANDTVFTVTIAFGTVVETLTYLSDAGSSATEIATGLRAELAKFTGVGGSLYGLVGSGTATFIITGPADGRGFTPVNVGVGVVAWVETTAEVRTHLLLTRGDKIAASATIVGSIPVNVPHSAA
jgi:hypothetical protein